MVIGAVHSHQDWTGLKSAVYLTTDGSGVSRQLVSWLNIFRATVEFVRILIIKHPVLYLVP